MGSFVLRFFVFEMEMSCSLLRLLAGILYFLLVFFVVFGGGSAVWWWLLEGWSASVSYAGDSATAMLFFAFVICVVGRICRVLLCAGCVHDIHGTVGLATTEKAAGGGRKIICYSFVHRRSFMYQHESMSCWLLDPIFGGFGPLPGSSLLGDVGFLEVLEASDPSLPVDCLPVRSVVTQHVKSDVLLKTAPKNLVLRQ
ncbi:hypothetical protein C2845_PM09G20430 [Panicum miliaceum]|uniref:Transmembrane protein n=1 Tax=Panicum miliaceum TaxID=4540 RepID=A0A3L6S1I6_PANMI|nr:hypothetical protein C2845_PM09G20430 [Panicum miliaceum]